MWKLQANELMKLAANPAPRPKVFHRQFTLLKHLSCGHRSPALAVASCRTNYLRLQRKPSLAIDYRRSRRRRQKRCKMGERPGCVGPLF